MNVHSFFKRKTKTVLILSVFALILLPFLPAQNKTKSEVLIKAAQGGQVRSTSGKALLTIPPDALSADTKISLNELPPPEGQIIGPLFELLPDGLSFRKPAILTVTFSAKDVPQDFLAEDVVLASYQAQASTPLPQAQPDQGPTITEGWEFQETKVDISAGTACLELTHLSRYALRACSSWRIGDNKNSLIKSKFDFGMKFSVATGAGSSASASFKFDGSLFAKVKMPLGSEGMATARSDLIKFFRVKPGLRGQRSTSEAMISIQLSHDAEICKETNNYHISIGVSCYDQKGSGIGKPSTQDLPAKGQFISVGSFTQTFYLDPNPNSSALPWGPSYAPFHAIIYFKNCRLEAGKYYTVHIAGTAHVWGKKKEDRTPPWGGCLDWGQRSFPASLFQVGEINIYSN